MTVTARVLRYERRRLLHDRIRLFLLLLSIILLLLFLFYPIFEYLGVGFGETAQAQNAWNEEMARQCAEQAEYYHEQYLQGLANIPNSIGYVPDAEENFRLWKLYVFYGQEKSIQFYEGFSNTFCLLPISALSRSYPYLSIARQYLYLDNLYLFFPVLLAIENFFLFAQERITGFDQNIRLLGIREKETLRGKVIFSLLEFLFLFLFFFLIGLSFSSPNPIAVFDGTEYRAFSSFSLYLQRSGEMLFDLLPFELSDILLYTLIKNNVLTVILSFFSSLLLLPNLIKISTSLSTSEKYKGEEKNPFYGFLFSDGFFSLGFSKRMILPLILVVLLLLSVFLLLFFSDRITSFRKRIRENQ